MKKILIVLLLSFSYVFANSQVIVNRAGQANTVSDARLQAALNFFAPRYADTTAANVAKGIDSCGALIYTYNTQSFWYRKCSPKVWTEFTSGGGTSVTVVSYGKNASGDSTVLVLSNGVRYAAKDSIGIDAITCEGLKQGGIVTWDSLLVFSVNAATYCINNVAYNSLSGSITLDAAHSTLDRIDVIALDTNGLIVKITGTPAADPAIPQIDGNSQLYLTSVFIGAGATTPTVPNNPPPANVIIWNENLGAPTEYVASASGLTSNFNYTAVPANVYAPVKSSDIGSFTVNDIVTYTGTPAYSIANYPIVRFFIKNKLAIANNAQIGVQLMSGGVVRTTTLNLTAAHGYSKSITATFQNVSIPISDFTFFQLTSTIDGIRFITTGSGGGFYIDYITLNAGLQNNTPQGDFMTNVFRKAGTDSVFKTINNINSFAFRDSIGGSGTSTINIFNDTTLIICSNGTNLCDTAYITNIANIQLVTILNDSMLLVCDSLDVCDTITFTVPNFDPNSYWSTTGNTGTNGAINFIGTKDNNSFTIRTNNTTKATIAANGDANLYGTNFTHWSRPSTPSLFLTRGDPTDGYQFGNMGVMSKTNNESVMLTLRATGNRGGIMTNPGGVDYFYPFVFRLDGTGTIIHDLHYNGFPIVSDTSAQLEVKSTSRGTLLTRLTTAQIALIPSPKAGLILFNTDSSSYFQYTGSVWQNLYNTGGAGGAGNANSNIGSGYRWAVPNTNNVKTLFTTAPLLTDSATNTNALTITADTSKSVGRLATYSDIQSRVDTADAVAYTFSGLRNHDLLKYDSVNNRFVNFRLNVTNPLLYDYVTNTLSPDTTTDITGLATKAFVLNNAGGGGASYTFSTGLTNTASTITNNVSTGISGGQTINGGTAANDDLTIQGTTNATKTTSYVNIQPQADGLVGIGTTTPSSTAKLTVTGTTGTNFSSSIFKAYINATDGVFLGYNSASTYGFIGAVKEGVSNDNFLISPSGGNVSIGTTTFSDKLRVNGTGRFGTGTGSPTFSTTGVVVNMAGRTTYENLNSSLNITSYWMTDNNGDVNGAILATQTNHPLAFRTNATTRMYIQNTGQIGIGKTTDATALIHFKPGGTAASSAPLKLTSTKLATTATTGTGTNATVTFATQLVAPFAVGSTIVIAGVTPVGYNGSWTVQSSTTTTVVFASSATGAQTVAGTVSQPTKLTTPEEGAVEYDGTTFYFTRSGTTRESILTGVANVVSPTAPNRTISVVIDGTTYYIHAKTTND